MMGRGILRNSYAFLAFLDKNCRKTVGQGGQHYPKSAKRKGNGKRN